MAFKLIRQKDSMQCGTACLAMVCRYWGMKISIDKLESICPASKEGISMLAMSETAEKLGFENVTVKLTFERLVEVPLPAILHWEQNHFVVLYKINKDGRVLYVADPGIGKIKYTSDDFKAHWISDNNLEDEKGVAMFLQPSDNYSNKIEDNNPEKLSLKFLFGYIKRYKTHLEVIILGLILGCILQLIMPFLTQSIVDVGISHHDIKFIWLVLLGELFIITGRTINDFIRRRLLLHISMRLNISLVSDFFIKLLKLPMAYFDTKLIGDLMQRMSDHNRVQTFLTNQVLNVIFTILSVIVFGAVLLVFNLLIFGVFVICTLAYIGWIALFLQRRKVLDYEIFVQQSKNNDKTYQFLSNIQEIKLQDCEQRRRWEWEDIQAELFIIQLKSLKLHQTQELGGIFINELKNIIITVLSATAVINGDMTLGTMLAVQFIIGQLNSPIDQFMSFIYSLQDVKISIERISEIHDAKTEDQVNENKIKNFVADKSISLSNVDFKYDPHSPKMTITDVSIDIPHDKMTAIVGASGSGKTTLIKLILGYYPILSGLITIAGRNINEYNLKWWRKQCGVVMQDGVIFSESIARNIAISDDDIDFVQLEYAARLANIHDYIMSLPLKYNTIIGRDGIGLSQGQKQRILIARAVYKNPDFIFFDEATNALDAKNERAIVENLAEFYRGRTVVVVAHRLSTVRNADQIIVLDGGRVVEIGNHLTLIKSKGAYYNLVKNQLELGD